MFWFWIFSDVIFRMTPIYYGHHSTLDVSAWTRSPPMAKHHLALIDTRREVLLPYCINQLGILSKYHLLLKPLIYVHDL